MAAINVDETCCALPISPQDCREASVLTDRDVDEILERKFGGGNCRLISWRLKPLDKTMGFLGQYYHVRVTARVNDKTENLRFFAKTPPPLTSPQFGFLMERDTFNKEISVYTDLVRRMGVGDCFKWMVDCYFCKRNVIIVLEDASMDGYATLDKYVPFDDEEHCIWLLRALSRLHSRSLILEEKLRRESGLTILDLYGHLLNEVLFMTENKRSEAALESSITGLCAMIDLVEELDDNDKVVVRRRVKEWGRKISRLLAPSSEHRNVICHRDTWANNLMFRHDQAGRPDGCYIIDFQFLRYCPPAIDFASCLYLTTDRATWQQHFDSFDSRIYHDSFARGLAEEGLDAENYLPWTAFWKSYAEARNVALIYAGLNLQIMLLPSQATSDYFYGAASAQLEQVLYGDKRAELVRHQCQNVPAYKTRMSEIVLEIRDRLPEHPPNL